MPQDLRPSDVWEAASEIARIASGAHASQTKQIEALAQQYAARVELDRMKHEHRGAANALRQLADVLMQKAVEARVFEDGETTKRKFLVNAEKGKWRSGPSWWRRLWD